MSEQSEMTVCTCATSDAACPAPHTLAWPLKMMLARCARDWAQTPGEIAQVDQIWAALRSAAEEDAAAEAELRSTVTELQDYMLRKFNPGVSSPTDGTR